MTKSFDYRIQVKARTDIAKGEEITTQYMPTTSKGTYYRRKEMEQMWCFQCSCILCRDPTESGTMFSALKCPVCCEGEDSEEGYFLPMDPLNPESTWKCKVCSFTEGINDIDQQNIEMEKLLDAGIRKAKVTDDGDVPELKHLLVTFQETFHENHYLIIRLKQKLGVLIGPKDVYDDLDSISTNLIKQKLSACQDVIKVKSRLERGLNGKWKDIMDCEIDRCVVELSKRAS